MLKVYNTLTRKKEILKPRQGRLIELFVCGPTVYDSPHLGHARTYLAFDLIVKYLREKGYDVFYLQNITDIDDKIIQRAKERKIRPQKLARQFEKEYLRDMRALKINSVTRYARATDHIKEIVSQIGRLLKKGYAYQIKDGIYYNISRFKNYGKLSKRTAIMAEDAISRIDESKEKKNKGDFCLWKFSKPEEPKWTPPTHHPIIKTGRPGWHIEDTAITEKFFGAQYDIHGGAKDLIFPHHEAEIAQMEGISGKSPMVKYWMHAGFLTVKGKKMAKSLGNFITVKDFIENHSPRLLRFLVIKNHYRSALDYNENAVLQTKKELERIDEFIDKIRTIKKIGGRRNFRRSLVLKTGKDFKVAMEDDFNTPKAIAAIFELINRGNSLVDKNLLTQTDVREILEFLKKIDRFFNFIFWTPPTRREKPIPNQILKLVKEREKYRTRKDWQKADQIRKKIQEMGYKVEDTGEGPKLKKI